MTSDLAFCEETLRAGFDHFSAEMSDQGSFQQEKSIPIFVSIFKINENGKYSQVNVNAI